MVDLDDSRVIDFTGCKRRNKGYGGANGEKISIEYAGDVYMLKFPGISKVNKTMHYSNSVVSEFLGCHVYELLGMPVQETLLGKYCVNGVYKEVVACKDFTFVDGKSCTIMDFASTKNTVIDSSRSGRGTELSAVLAAIEGQNLLDPCVLEDYFWDMFVVDALIGNWDRHNGNWGLLYNQATDEVIGLCPVFDCGSSLFPQVDESMMESIINDDRELKVRVYERPLSALTLEGRKINYFDFITGCKYDGCKKAIRRIVPRISMTKVRELVYSIPGISELCKQFYIKVLTARKELILDRGFNEFIPMSLF